MTTYPLRAEWAKVTTLRPLWTTPLIATGLGAGITLAVQLAYGKVDTSLQDDPMEGLYYGLNFSQVAVACLGILLIGQEYATGTVRGSLTAVPDRTRFYSGKLLIGALLGLVTGLATVAGSALATAGTVGLDLGRPGAVRALIAGVLYHPLLVVLCLGITTMLRNLTAAMGLLTPTLFLGTTLLTALPGLREIAWLFPDRAGLYALRLNLNPDIPIGHTTGLLVMAGWTALAAYGGLRVLKRQDA
jgi:ABC-2 type transport system permease protein